MHSVGNDASYDFDGQEKYQCFPCHPKANITIYGLYKMLYLNSWEILKLCIHQGNT